VRIQLRDTQTASNAQIAVRWEDEFKNKGNLAICDELMTADFVHRLPFPGLPAGSEGMKQVGRMVFGAIGDIKVVHELVVSEGDLVVIRAVAHGTRRSDGKPMDWYEHTIYRLKDGKMVEQWPGPVGLEL
jgi:ketosteroid isomerase-like protein